jgi:hypothetical protein
VPRHLQFAKLVTCPSCKVSLFLEDDAVKNAGTRAAIADGASIFSLGVPFTYRGLTYFPHGRIRFDYGQGFWDEWWVSSDTGEQSWVSVDEGDIAIEQPLSMNDAAPSYASLNVGSHVTVGPQKLLVTEKNSAECIGFEGELPEVIAIGETHHFVHLSGPKGLLLTIEYADDSEQIFKGLWVDPFEVNA